MARQVLFVFILLYLCLNLIKSDQELRSRKVLHVYKDDLVNSRGKRTIVINSDDVIPPHHLRNKREVLKPDKVNNNINITVKVRFI